MYMLGLYKQGILCLIPLPILMYILFPIHGIESTNAVEVTNI